MPDERARVGRRAFLALGAGIFLAGCVQGSTPAGRETTETTVPQGDSPSSTADGKTKTAETNRTETTTTDRDGITIGINSNKSEPQATETIRGTGKRDSFEDEDGITVWNDADTARRITVAVGEKDTSGEPLFQKTYRFKPDAYVSIGIKTPGEYVVTVGVEGEEPETVDFTVDDCNDQSLFITIMPNGSVRSSGISTAMACGTI